MPRLLSPEGFIDLVEDITEDLAEEAGVPEEQVVFILPDVEGGSVYTASQSNPNDRIHVRLAYGQDGEGVKTQEMERGLQGIAMGGIRGALIGTGVVTIDELGPEATGIALENIGRVPEPHEAPEGEEREGHTTAHLSTRERDHPMETEDGEALQ